MKKNIFLSLCAAALLVSCGKEETPDANATDNQVNDLNLTSGVYAAKLTASPISTYEGETKAGFNTETYTFGWEAGDRIACYQQFSVASSEETNVSTVMTTEAGDGNFAGTIPYTELEDQGYYMNFLYPASLVMGVYQDATVNATQGTIKINLPSQQDGRLENLGDYFLTSAYKKEITVTSSEEPVSVSNVVFDKHVVVCVKVNVPQALNVQSIDLQASYIHPTTGYKIIRLAGEAQLKVQNSQIKQNNLTESTLTIKHADGSSISGDTYACIIPFEQDQSYSRAQKLTFKLTNADGQTFTFSKAVEQGEKGTEKGLRKGKIYDMGSFPTSCVTPKLGVDENGAVILTAAPSEAKIYYTTDGQMPSSTSSVYEGPITISSATELKAVAVCEGLDDSQVAEFSLGGEVTAPVIVINEAGNLAVEAKAGYTYTYSLTADGSVPGDPATVLPADGVADVLTTGTYRIKVKATDVLGTSAITNACYRVFVAKNFTDTNINADQSNKEVLAPFTATNTGETDFEISRENYGNSFGLIAGNNAAANLLNIGTQLLYGGKVSLAIKEKNEKVIFFYYDNSEVSREKTTADQWFVVGSQDDCDSDKEVYFKANNYAVIYGFGLIEQGFESFEVSADVSNETPVDGQEIAY